MARTRSTKPFCSSSVAPVTTDLSMSAHTNRSSADRSISRENSSSSIATHTGRNVLGAKSATVADSTFEGESRLHVKAAGVLCTWAVVPVKPVTSAEAHALSASHPTLDRVPAPDSSLAQAAAAAAAAAAGGAARTAAAP
eukprot:1672625-Pleurochrysis_carterae.AAC.1